MLSLTVFLGVGLLMMFLPPVILEGTKLEEAGMYLSVVLFPLWVMGIYWLGTPEYRMGYYSLAVSFSVVALGIRIKLMLKQRP